MKSMPYSDEEIEQEFNKWLFNMVLQNINIVFRETNIQLQSAINYSQYIFTEKKLVTLIGEIHGVEFTCNTENQQDITQYALNMIQRNAKSLILLEKHEHTPNEAYYSRPIREIDSTLKQYNQEHRAVNFDWRPFLIGFEALDIIYGNKIPNYNEDTLVNQLIKPVYKRWKRAFALEPSLYTRHGYEFLNDRYLVDLDNNFKYITKLLEEKQRQDIPRLFKEVFMKITDFFILRELLKNDDIDEYLIVVGEQHRYNIQTIFNPPMFIRINQQEGRPDNCVNLFETYRIEK